MRSAKADTLRQFFRYFFFSPAFIQQIYKRNRTVFFCSFLKNVPYSRSRPGRKNRLLFDQFIISSFDRIKLPFDSYQRICRFLAHCRRPFQPQFFYFLRLICFFRIFNFSRVFFVFHLLLTDLFQFPQQFQPAHIIFL